MGKSGSWFRTGIIFFSSSSSSLDYVIPLLVLSSLFSLQENRYAVVDVCYPEAVSDISQRM